MLDVNIKKRFVTAGQVTFSLEAAFTVGQGISVLFGPSGAGKTTILRAIAGILTPDEGRVGVNGDVYFDSRQSINLPLGRRRVGFVFQDYLLFPHMTAMQNAAYGVREGTEKVRRAHAREMLAMLGIEHAADRYPHRLSGGEQQRVALARALASDPAALLLDEPLSAVDASTRARLLEEIVEAQRKSRVPFLYVTHAPADAVRAGDAALILEQGRVVQQGKPQEVFNAPASARAARAAGEDNILLGRVAAQQAAEGITWVDAGGCRLATSYNALAVGSRITLGIPSDDIIISRERLTQTSARNLLPGTLKRILRDAEKVELVIDCGVDLKVRVTGQAVEALGLAPGVAVYLLIKASACHLLA
jgi:molybdate transport system ATP-binding protein